MLELKKTASLLEKNPIYIFSHWQSESKPNKQEKGENSHILYSIK
jgi:hypothetical protein